jgi:hypothetical protein
MTKEITPISPETSVKILNITTQNITPLAGDSVKILNLTAESIYSLPDASLDVYGDIVFNGAVGVNGDLVVNPDNAIRVKNIDPTENTTYVQVGGDLYIDPGKTIFVDSITPHIHVGEPPSVKINGLLDMSSHDIIANNVRTKYLEAIPGATDNQIGVYGDVALLNNNKLKVDRIGKMSANKVTITDDVEIQGTLTITGQTTITTGTTSNVYSKDEVNQTFANLIDSAPAALNTLKELASALNNDGNYATTVQTQLSNKADKATT